MRRSLASVSVSFAFATLSCGRIGYDDVTGFRGGSPADGVAAASGHGGENGATAAAGAGAASSGGASNGTGGRDVAPTGGAGVGGSTVDGSVSGSGGAIAGGGAPGAGAGSGVGAGGGIGSGGSGASLGVGGAAGSGGVLGSGGSIGSGGVVGTGGSGGTTGVGCADGEREGYLALSTYPDIAACAGGFALPGIIGLAGPACALGGGDDGSVPDGAGCNALDLCEAGFHVCMNAADVSARSSTGCAGVAVGSELVFFATAQNGAGQAQCGTSGTDDVYGCGTLGAPPHVNCAPLDAWSGNRCQDLTAPWSCGTTQGVEALNLVKPGSAGGGVLCCRD